ncbi:hypothetical protein [Stieleria varia]|uniref:Uncharacterized protein n=1 Tax=Stieleria varia TaxID=2528005 RepID=A0A5C6AZB3_9BACT|nr:hypothetical protein [Stieleria varia]TWU04472.1 hypothetical protein Pla52n_25130 [Stieleria varia]
MAHLIAKQGTWNVVPGGISDTPRLVVPQVLDGMLIQVKCEFMANTGVDGGFYYATQSPQIPSAMSAAQRIISGTNGWVNVAMTSFWTHANDGKVEDITFEMDFTTGGFTKHGQIGQFLMYASVETLH